MSRKTRAGASEDEADALLVLQTLAFRREWRPVLGALQAFRLAFLDGIRGVVVDGHAPSLPHLALKSIPPSFLQYVSEGNPGHALLGASMRHRLDRLLYSGEATRTSRTGVAQALPHVGRVLQILQGSVEGVIRHNDEIRERLQAAEGGVGLESMRVQEGVGRTLRELSNQFRKLPVPSDSEHQDTKGVEEWEERLPLVQELAQRSWDETLAAFQLGQSHVA